MLKLHPETQKNIFLVFFYYSRLRSIFFYRFCSTGVGTVIMEFGRKQERPYLRLIESAAFESCFSKRSETKEKTTDTLLKQDVLRDETFSIGRVIASIQPSIF